MGKKVIYECDVCGRVSENEDDLKLRKVIVSFLSSVHEANGVHNTECEVCPKCLERVIDVPLIDMLKVITKETY